MRRNHGSVLISTGLLVAANLLIPVAILIFATGFFPYKPFLPGLAQYDDLGHGSSSPPPAPFDRLVFMVVDALRSDFVYVQGSGFEFTQSLIADGVAIPFTAHATSPTITMPRIKAMTTGSTPSFLDALLSFDEADTSSTLAAQDTWLAQMKAKGTGKLVMYGDDTWLKLFPGTFDRADGTSSFFVSDFTEVDNNVTRHIADELRNDDWNTMVLHYLGLDHIGHKTGPRGPSMIPKQREMDGIVRQIYEAIETLPHLQSTLLVFCGDHGMNDAGNHGASSPGETSAALVFVSPKFKMLNKGLQSPAAYAEDFQYYSLVEQSDLAPTLAALLGFPVPKNNLGSFILDFLPFWPEARDKFRILARNARQILDVVGATLGSPSKGHEPHNCLRPTSPAVELVCEWQQTSEAAERAAAKAKRDDDDAWILDLSQWLSKAQALMSSMASNYNMDRLTGGAAVATVAAAAAIAALAVSRIVTVARLGPFALITLLYGIMMFASSYVEEEQHFWYWAASAWLSYLALWRAPKPTCRSLTIACAGIGSMRLIRGWNQTGQKFAGEPDIVTMFLTPQPFLLWSLVLATYGMVARELLSDLAEVPSAAAGSVVLGLITSALSFKLAFTKEDAPELVVGLARTVAYLFDGPSLITRARAVFMGIGFTSLYPMYILATQPTSSSRERAIRILHHLYTLLALTQSRATNAPLFLLFQGVYWCLDQMRLDAVDVTTTALLMQYASFFAMGGTNAISGVDLSSAYNGVAGFNIVAIGVLTFVSNWAAPVWWVSAANLLLLESRRGGNRAGGAGPPGAAHDNKNKNNDDNNNNSSSRAGDGGGGGGGGGGVFAQHAAMLTVFAAVSLVFVMAACTALRTHLFIWTVFSPKYLYSMAWNLGQHLVVNLGLGGLLYRLGRG
ncbi:GPI ethanolamine phosphate transferase [Xylariaceae sp. FL0804]|nr:GPI ethanolamine phosphate transferase [Xylariaceae sp. FL0804]